MAPDRTDRAGLRADLLALIAEHAPGVDGTLADHTALITSGILESAALLHVALWVENRLGGDVDITAFDLAAEWDSVAAILDFVARHRAPAPDPTRAS